eukprot:Nk52_evm24s151 gene=Nk52_evmTU24s151
MEYVKKSGMFLMDKVLVAGRPDDAPLMTKGDIDGFFAFFMNTLVDFTLTLSMGTAIVGWDADFVSSSILPGTALVVLLGNAYYFWEARMLMRKEGRHDVCASPFGIATPSLIAFVVSVMGPVYAEKKDSEFAYKVGLASSFITGLVTLAGVIYGRYLRKYFPPAAMLAGISGIGLTLISMDFAFKIFDKPLLALLPVFLFFYVLLTGKELPFRIPTGVALIVFGTALGWALKGLGSDEWERPEYNSSIQFCYPRWTSEWLTEFGETAPYLTIVIPLALINLVGSIQCLTSAEGAGDKFSTSPTIVVNGGLMAVSCFLGNPFPTTLYIGHPMYKKIGARAAYSLINGVVIYVLVSMGAITEILRVMPQECLYPILLVIGVGIIGESFEAVPKRHYLPLAIGILPACAQWGSSIISTALATSNSYLSANNSTIVLTQENTAALFYQNNLTIDGVYSLAQGYLITSLLLTACFVFFVDRKHLPASICCLLLAIASYTGLIHAYKYNGGGFVEGLYIGEEGYFGPAAPKFAGIYAAVFLICLVMHFFLRGGEFNEEEENSTGSSLETCSDNIEISRDGQVLPITVSAKKLSSA